MRVCVHKRTMDNKIESKFDPNEVQICKSYSAVNSRITNFLKRKREESNDINTRVYCSLVSSSDSSRTCSTIAAKRQIGSESFVKNSKVVNHSGPQCNGGLDPASQNSYKLSSNENSIGQKPDVYERISNLEKCLNFKNDNDIDIYKKLKSIEDHVLKLENMLLNTGKFSLSSICSNDNQPMEIVNHNLKIDINNIQDKLGTKDNLMNEDKSSSVLPTKSKYSAEEIHKLIISIKNNDGKTN